MQKKRPAVRILLSLIVLAAIGAALVVRLRANAANPDKAGAPKDRATAVLTATVQKSDVPIDLEGIGSAVAIQTVTVRPQVDGRIDKVFFHEGQAVKKGELLAQIDPRPFNILLQQAQGNLVRDQATLEGSNAALERLTKLAGEKYVSPQDVQNQKALVGQTKGSVLIDQAQIETAQLNLSYARITAPIDGVTGIRLIDPGNYVRAGDAGGLVMITQLDPIAVIFSLPQDDLPKVAEQLAHGAVLTVDAYDRGGITKLATGELKLIDNQVVTSTATIRLKAVFPNTDRRLWPNMFVKARLHLETRKDVLVIPSSALQRGPRGPFVYAIKPDQTAEVRLVEVELSLADQTVIRKGVSEGEQVVVEGQGQLRPGAKVQVRPATPEQAGAPRGDLP